MTRHKKIPTLIGLIVLILGAALGVYLVTNTTILNSQASPQTTPKDIRLSNITDNSFTVSWTTDADTLGAIDWGESQNLGQTQIDTPEFRQVHYITIKNLTPQTNYFYTVNSGGVNFDNAGIPWTVTTLPILDASSNSEVISGNIVDNTDSPASDVIVYVNADGVNTLSAKTAASGSFFIPLTGVLLSPEDLLQVFAQGGTKGTSSAQVFFKSANPIPQMVLGQTQDFRNLEEVNQAGVPKSSIDVPEDIQGPASRITLENSTQTSATPFPVTTVTLESVLDSEIIVDTTPEFSGRAPAGKTITITVQSDPITEEIEASENGSWSWVPPQELEPGAHTVTVVWADDNGVLQTLTRSFEVSAQEMPQATPEPTIYPTPVDSSNSAGLTLTIILSIIGIGLIITGVIWNIRLNK